MKAVIKFILSGILGAIFVWQAWSTVTKYMAEKTNLQVFKCFGTGYIIHNLIIGLRIFEY